LRVLRVLEGTGKDYLNNPEQLKSILCPLIARSPAEQNKFYELFDLYAADLKKPLPELPPPPPPPPWHEKVPSFVWWLLGALLTAMLFYTVYRLTRVPPPVPHPTVFFQHDGEKKIGDTLFVENLTERMDTAHHKYLWEVLDGESAEIEIRNEQDYHLAIPIAEPKGGHEKIIRYTVSHYDEHDTTYVHESRTGRYQAGNKNSKREKI